VFVVFVVFVVLVVFPVPAVGAGDLMRNFSGV
jgi:hypothetical protein